MGREVSAEVFSREDRREIGPVGAQDVRHQRGHPLQLPGRPEEKRAQQRHAPSEQRVEDAHACQVRPASARLRQQHEHRSDQRGERGIVDPPDRHCRRRQREEDHAGERRLPDPGDGDARHAADHGAGDALHAAAHGGHRVRLEDDHDGDGHPVAALEVQQGRDQLRRGGDHGDAQAMPQLGRSGRQRVAQGRRRVRRNEGTAGSGTAHAAALQSLHRFQGVPRLGGYAVEQGRKSGVRVHLRQPQLAGSVPAIADRLGDLVVDSPQLRERIGRPAGSVARALEA